MTSETPSDEVRRKWLKPKCTFEDVMAVLKSSFAKSLDLANNATISITKKLDSYDDENFLLSHTTSTNITTKYLVKVHNGVESESASIIDYQNKIMLHLNGADGITTTTPLTCDSGDLCVTTPLPVQSPSHSPSPLCVRLLTYIEGTPMAYKNVTADLLHDAGEYLANVDSSLDNFDHPAAKRFHAWDQRNTTSLREFVQYIQTQERQAMISDIIDVFEKTVLVDDEKLRKGVLQSDFNDANIILDGSDKLAGVIDFGDSVYSWRVLDLSVAMAYAMLSSYGKTCHSLAAASSFLRGFNSKYPLDAVEKKHLRVLVACRLACSATLGAYSYSQDPSNKYLLLHAEPCWNALEMLWKEVPAQVVESMFGLACNPPAAGGTNDIAIPDPSVKDILVSARGKRERTEGEGDKIVFVTGNKKKLEEVKQILKGCELTNFKLDLPELQGDPLYVSKEKCVLAAKEIGGAVITEDTSLCFNALNGMPGPYIKWFLESCGHGGLNKMLDGFEDRSAYAQTVVAYCGGEGQEVLLFDGRTNGVIVEARGPTDFGWDPIFECAEGGKTTNGLTYAEMDKAEKNKVSHRGKAFEQLKAYLRKEGKM
ncbi:hypothetical protein TL16_g12090 [Triparma laevis f. inornata]|uniref:Inosine triphosphate pyrophosphatase n=2 Tax=Triparma laevis TaxID=1534972 RepID=A0A9W7C6N6_9STRA|nr:hypothetical protein TL16_g12090 [Triparma laevis f. inornata]GMI02862.1 hypothetical protein TrLO_g14075 [Triparma laevis f. longispina]